MTSLHTDKICDGIYLLGLAKSYQPQDKHMVRYLLLLLLLLLFITTSQDSVETFRKDPVDEMLFKTKKAILHTCISELPLHVGGEPLQATVVADARSHRT